MIPLEKLNNYILNLSKRKVNLYFLKDLRFRKLDSWKLLVARTRKQLQFWPVVFMHDQEMLNFDLYRDQNIQDQQTYLSNKDWCFLPNLNLRWANWRNVHDRYIITHSEKNSRQVEIYREHGFEPVYFWSHALVAKDWYRYAEHDPLLEHRNQQSLPWKDFLIYSRGWQGTREYRLKLAEMIIEQKLHTKSILRIAHEENNIRLKNYTPQNSIWDTDCTSLERILPDTEVSSDASAWYQAQDFIDSGISIVLETNFDDPRIHLTEKILRPLAIGHPFILVSSPGCLDYLRSYGFETFSQAGINEEYDTISDPYLRLQSIVNEMRRISDLAPDQKINLFNKLYQVAQRNKKRFFDPAFSEYCINEMRNNYTAALESVSKNRHSRVWLKNRKIRRSVKGSDFDKTIGIGVVGRRRYRQDLLLARSYRRRSNGN